VPDLGVADHFLAILCAVPGTQDVLVVDSSQMCRWNRPNIRAAILACAAQLLFRDPGYNQLCEHLLALHHQLHVNVAGDPSKPLPNAQHHRAATHAFRRGARLACVAHLLRFVLHHGHVDDDGHHVDLQVNFRPKIRNNEAAQRFQCHLGQLPRRCSNCQNTFGARDAGQVKS
jgi:hypothetical protein